MSLRLYGKMTFPYGPSKIHDLNSRSAFLYPQELIKHHIKISNDFLSAELNSICPE
jgi:hypothetical protein